MSATLIMHANEVAQNRDRWLAERRKIRDGAPGITASEIASVLGIAPASHGSPFKLYHDKLLGEIHDDNDSMMRGRYLEPYVVERVEVEHPEWDVLPGGLYASADRPWQLATFDRFVFDRGSLPPDTPFIIPDGDRSVPLQIKTAMSRYEFGEEWTDDLPGHYRAQELQEMDVKGSDIGVVPVLFIQEWQVRIFVIERDAAAERDISFMRERGEEFRDRLATHRPPPVDWTPVTTSTLRRVYSGPLEDREVRIPKRLRDQYRSARVAAKRADQRLGLAVNQMRERLGNARTAVVNEDGEDVRVVTRSLYDVEPRVQTVEGFTVDKFNPCRGAK
jgi:putative phage-type endonuclease